MKEPAQEKGSREAQSDCDHLLSNYKTLQLATLDAHGRPQASYAPFLLVAGDFYCFLSELAQHTENLRVRPTASLLVIEDELRCRNLFARARLNISVHSHEIDRHSELGKAILEQFHERFGETVAVLEALPDFHLFQLRPQTASLVRGFGQAWRLDSRLNVVGKVEGPSE